MNKFRIAILGLTIMASSLASAGSGSRAEFRETYLKDSPETVTSETAYFTVVGSFKSEAAAQSFVNKTLAANSNIDLEVWPPVENSIYWAVMIATNTSAKNSMDACLEAKKRSIAKKPYQWTYPHKITYC